MEQQSGSEGRSKKEERTGTWTTLMERTPPLGGVILGALFNALFKAGIDFVISQFTGESGGETKVETPTKDEDPGGEPREER